MSFLFFAVSRMITEPWAYPAKIRRNVYGNAQLRAGLFPEAGKPSSFKARTPKLCRSFSLSKRLRELHPDPKHLPAFVSGRKCC